MSVSAGSVLHGWQTGLRGLRHPSWAKLGLAAGYVILYLLLDKLSFVEALHGIDITPWNPQPGLTLALLVLNGAGYIPAAVVAPLLSSQLLPLVPIPLLPALAAALVTAGAYGLAAAVLRRQIGIDARLQSPHGIVLLILVALGAAGFVAFGVVGIYAAAGLLPGSDFLEAAFQLWIGDAIGIVVTAPLVLVLAAHPPRRWTMLRRNWPALFETAVQWACIFGALALAFGLDHHRDSFKLFYLLFLPLVWIAARRGLSGAAWAVLTIQGGLIAALEFTDEPAAVIRAFQLLMFAVATTGLLLGAFVSERQRVARALAMSQSRLAAILDTARDGVLMIDAEGRIESVNPAVEQLFAYPAERLIGRDTGELIAAADLVASLAATARSATGAAARRELEARRADGSLFPIELTVGHFGAAEDGHYTLVIRDITARREAEARERLHRSEIAQVSQASLAGEMTSALAHELNQPLTAIAAYARGCLRLLRQTPLRQTPLRQTPGDPELLREGIEEVVRQAQRAGEIIAWLREFARGGTIQPSTIDVAALVEAVIDLVRGEAAQNRIEIRSRIPAGLPPVRADRIQIEQVLLNLLRNAIDAVLGASARQKRIVVAAREAGRDRVEIVVTDSGSGVAEEARARLFEPFVTTKPDGMGLGLSISRSIIEAHRGRLWLAETSGSGATFAFDLPTTTVAARRRVG